MPAVRTALMSLFLVTTLSGCVAPGSSIGRLSIRGTLATAEGVPLSNRELQFLLPAAYGLGGLDLVLNKPEDFGHQDHVFRITTGPDGDFSHELGDRIYHMSFWLLPPLGGFPRHPPAPFLLVRVADVPGEYYAVQTQDGQFRVYTDNGAELPLHDARLSELSAHNESGSNDDGRWTAGVIDLRVSGVSRAVQQADEADVE